MREAEIHEEISSGGIVLKLIAIPWGEDGWELNIANQQQQRTCWDEFFDSAEAALAAGRQAIETEGAQTFADIEDLKIGADFLREIAKNLAKLRANKL